MALPADVTTFSLTFGHSTNGYTDSTGAIALVGAKVKLWPVDLVTGKRLVVTHVATGQVIVPVDVTVTIDAEGKATVGPLPHTDNPTLSPVGFGYHAEWQVVTGSHRAAPRNKTFAAPAASGATVDFDLLDVAAAVPGVLVPMGVSAGVADAAVSALLPGPSLTQAAFDGRYATDAELAAGLGTKVNSSTYTAGLAGKQDVATLAAATAAQVSNGSALDVALRAASVAAVQDAIEAGGGVALAPNAVGYTRFFRTFDIAWNFPSRVLPPQPNRRRYVIRNRGTNDIRIGYSTGDDANFNKPADAAFATVVPPGQEYVEGPSEQAVFVRPGVNGGAVLVSVLVELGA